MPKTKKDRGYWTWKSRTCPICKKRFQTSALKEAHRRTHDTPPVNQVGLNQSQPMEYSKEQHIADLQRDNNRLHSVNQHLIRSIAEILIMASEGRL